MRHRRVFPGFSSLSCSQRSFPSSSPASVARLRWIGPVRHHCSRLCSYSRLGREHELLVGSCLFALFNESGRLGSRNAVRVKSKPVGPVTDTVRGEPGPATRTDLGSAMRQPTASRKQPNQPIASTHSRGSRNTSSSGAEARPDATEASTRHNDDARNTKLVRDGRSGDADTQPA